MDQAEREALSIQAGEMALMDVGQLHNIVTQYTDHPAATFSPEFNTRMAEVAQAEIDRRAKATAPRQCPFPQCDKTAALASGLEAKAVQARAALHTLPYFQQYSEHMFVDYLEAKALGIRRHRAEYHG